MTNAPFKRFLLTWDASTGDDPEVREFDDPRAALDAYEAAEAKYRGRREIHVVLLGSDSLATIKKTHGNYWRDDDALDVIRAALAGAGK